MLAMLIAVNGCAVTTVGVSDPCAWVRPILVSSQDADCISDRLVEELLSHNDMYYQTCVDNE